MIAKINGTVSDIFEHSVVVDVNGVGYEVFLLSREMTEIEVGAQAGFYIAERIKEDEYSLYGFTVLSERSVYLMLTSVSGVGPKVAMAIISSNTATQINNALIAQDPAIFQRVSGVGSKTAQRIILDLRGKLVDPVKTADVRDDLAHRALMGLGMSSNDANKALEGVSPDLPTSDRVKLALKQGSN